jgi:alpha-ketoglutarate-dependent taurine dioxygenase
MLAQVKMLPETTAEQVAHSIKEEWKNNKVVHVVGAKSSDADQLRSFYDEVLETLGTPVNIGEDATQGSRDAQRTGQRWMEIRYDPEIPDAYRHSANPQPLHTDGSYIPSFPDAAIIYCQSSASNGGETVFIDAKHLLNALENEAPELLSKLRSTNVTHTRSGDTRQSPILTEENGSILLHWNYYCVDNDAPDPVKELREEFHNFLLNSASIKDNLEAVALRPGDCVIWKDYETLHGRNGFDPKVKSERFLWKSAVHIEAE